MKKLGISIIVVSCALMVSCQKTEPVNNTSDGALLTFVSAKPELEVSSKTEWTGAKVQWSAGDKIRIACKAVDGDWRSSSKAATTASEIKAYATDALEAATDVATFKLTTGFSGIEAGSYEFYAAYPYATISSSTFSTAPSLTGAVSASQILNENSFNPTYDYMVAKSNPVAFDTDGQTVDSGSSIALYWKRIVAHTLVNISNLAVVGTESISKIEFTFQDGAKATGTASFSILSGDIASITGTDNNKISLEGSISSTGSCSTWMTVFPFTATSVNVVVTTNNAVYTRTVPSTSLEFKSDKRNVLNIDMSSASRVEQQSVANVYTLTATQNSANSAYATNYTVGDWNAPGNQNNSGFWRIGGKNLSNVVRVLYRTATIANEITSVKINTNGVSNASFTVSSIKLSVHSTAADAASGDNAVDSVEITNPTIGTSTSYTAEFTRPSTSAAADWTNKYYRIAITCSNSNTSKNYGLDITSIQFYGYAE